MYKKIIERNKPYDDEKLIYDKDIHKYLLKQDYAKAFFGEEIGNKSEKEWKILQLSFSDNIYSFIYSFKSNELEYDIMEYDLATNKYYREVLAEVLINQCEYALTSNGDTVNLQHGVSVAAGKTTDLTILRGELLIAPKAYIKLHARGLLGTTNTIMDFDYSKYRKDY